MKIAIVGGGFCGVATAWHLLAYQAQHSVQVTLFDAVGIGGGASGLAAGLVHPYTARALRFPQGVAGITATKQLLRVASKSLNRPVADETGLLKIASTDDQRQLFQKCAKDYPEDVTWLDETQCKEIIPYLSDNPGILIRSGITVDCPLYLAGLWNACKQRGAQLQIKSITSLKELSDFDAIVIAMGASTRTLPELAHLPINQLKGQLIEVEWPSGISPLPCGLYSQAYLVMSPSKQSCIIGATFERGYATTEPTPETAVAELLPKAVELIPALEGARLISCRAGVRASAPQHQPIARQVLPNCWFIGGVGSKGLLFHALLAEKLAKEIVDNFHKSVI